MKNLLLYSAVMLIFCSCSLRENPTINIYSQNKITREIDYALQQMREAGQRVTISTNQNDDVNLIITLKEPSGKEPNDGYQRQTEKNTIHLSGECPRGIMYGILDMAEELNNGISWYKLTSRDIKAHHTFRAIKFNLPWYSYRSGENLALHYQTCRDLNFWEHFLNMMVENKFNTLTLWNMHPYMYMVKSELYPKSSPFTDEEMAEWESYWKSLFKMARDRGIDPYVVNWNIFVPREFAQTYDVAKYSEPKGFWGTGENSSDIEAYTKEVVTLTIDKYEDLTGIGLTLGERMGEMTSEQRRDWADRTIIAGLKDAKRTARLIYRAPLSAGLSSEGSVSVTTEQLTRNAIESMELDQDIWIEFKFNWSHAHSSPKLSIVHGGMLTDTYWTPLSDKYKAVWTMRNEDFFVMRWAQPDFIRDFITLNSQPYVGGCIIGSETYIPAKDYITKEEHKSSNYAFERQWLFYKVWGNLLFDPSMSDEYFADALAQKFNLESGSKLLDAWKLSSMNANRFASFYGGTWDATIYTEGFTTVGGKFIDVNNFIHHKVLDSSYVNIADFVLGKIDPDTQISPIELADITENESREAQKITDELRVHNPTKELLIELNDIDFWCAYGEYFALKIRAGVALQKYRTDFDIKNQERAIDYLEQAVETWKKMVEYAEAYNVATIPYQFDPEFSWRKHITAVEHDIEIARNDILPKM